MQCRIVSSGRRKAASPSGKALGRRPIEQPSSRSRPLSLFACYRPKAHHFISTPWHQRNGAAKLSQELAAWIHSPSLFNASIQARSYARAKSSTIPLTQELPELLVASVKHHEAYTPIPGKAWSCKIILTDGRALPLIIYPQLDHKAKELEKLTQAGPVKITAIQKDVRFQNYSLTDRTELIPISQEEAKPSK